MNWNYLATVGKPIYIYGMGNGADRCFEMLEKFDIHPRGVFASDEFVRGQEFHGFTVTTYAKAKESCPNMVVLVCFGTHIPSVIENIERIAKEQELYIPDFPVIPGENFSEAFYTKHKDRLDKVKAVLADEQSRIVFDRIIEYKLSGDLRILRSCETTVEESYENIIRLGTNETFVDLGAYRGETIKEFLAHTDSYDQVFAFEPDAYTFKHLSRNMENISNIHLFNVAASSNSGQISFSSRGGRNSSKSNSGKMIPCDSVDNLLEGTKATFFNIDVEGMEHEALQGCKNTIKQYKPKLLVAAYHRNEDLFEIPEQVLSMNSSYKVYMRHFPQIPAWDVNYYFV